ncbi:DNA-3-methyladenine glycosylase [Paenibacillus campi]|uniref:DNA-3-methyladenine glycosylase family protein n=1 Tax=Paenibacillus campi TaxID=3106031 RepID=UPI002AFEB524|nr:DNA-3-methyladenine glycosylase [Paenibacillus sp. SGZ-1009]
MTEHHSRLPADDDPTIHVQAEDHKIINAEQHALINNDHENNEHERAHQQSHHTVSATTQPKRTTAEVVPTESKSAYYAGLSLEEIQRFQQQGRWADYGDRLVLPVPVEFSFRMNVDFLRSSPNECLFSVREQTVYKALAVGKSRPLLRIVEAQAGGIEVQFLAGSAPQDEWERVAVAAYVSDWFDLGIDLLPFYKLARGDVLLGHAVESFYGLRNMGIPDLFETLCWGILGQQINIGYAHTLKCRLTEAFGEHVDYEGERYWIFPTAERIATLTMADLELMHMTVKKCEYILDAARLVASGELSKAKLLAAGDHKGAEKMLTHIRGIGPWTANYVLMRCLRLPTAFPIDDVGLHNVIRHLTGATAKPTREQLLKLAAGWSNWESYATFYLWRVLY